jgi:hypothetical protein
LPSARRARFDPAPLHQDATKFSSALVSPQELEAFLASQPGARDRPELLRSGVLRNSDPATSADQIRNLSTLTTALAEQGPSLPDGTFDFYKRNILELVTAPIRNVVRYQGRQPRSYAALV